MNEPAPVVFLAALFAGVGLLIAGLAVPLMRRRVARNWLYGLRVPATLAHDDIWYDANERSGRSLLALGIVTIILAFGFLIVPLEAFDTYVAIAVAVLVAGALIGAIDGWRYANRLLRDRQDEDGGPANVD